MKIVDLTTPETQVMKIKKAAYLGDYVFRILFTDGHENAVDLKPFLKKATHPSIAKYLDERLIKQFKIDNGNLNWNDYELIFPVADLYEGTIK
ncbi:MAG: DUF2442 domain-containing protein [Cyclobacteriaceae bacterium]|nr:DUF2442 domain-containing protein [Cyclobacteriaceae bacterium]